MTFVSELAPRPLWSHFDEILTIPRPSKGEERARSYVIQVAERLGLEHRVDETGNVVVKKPATPGHESAPATVIQAHLDMVQEKNSDVDFDWERDAIRPKLEGEYLTADGTTLGSDCGVGVASMLALAEARELAHGPLELLFTVDEETGLTGAAGLAGDLLEGRRLINVDSEEEGVLTIGCAGGADSTLELRIAKQPPPPGSRGLAVRLHGLKGGHSGVDIHLQRGNAIQLLARALATGAAGAPHQLGELAGGNAHNAIPREAHATLTALADDLPALRRGIEAELAAIRGEFAPAEPDLAWTVEEREPPAEVYDDASAAAVVHLVNALPHGVISMSYDIPGLVETSTNLATVAETDDRVRVQMSSRSSAESALAALRLRIRSIGRLAGARVEEGGGYPGWKPDVDSELLSVVRRVHERVLGREPEVGAIHAGLECGIIGEKYDGMDMISFGPQIEFPHSPDERVHVDSVKRYYELLTAVLEELAKTA
ncbi:MAG: aminoacyl-histidine dipeptidase [Thermoanaerobaculia bacterium]|nr:aminoacyl-histidine dipeptidase [Thermoanaerobaculia bacterium]